LVIVIYSSAESRHRRSRHPVGQAIRLTEPIVTLAQNRPLSIDTPPHTCFTHYPCEGWHWQRYDRHCVVMQSESLTLSSPVEQTPLNEAARGHSFRR